MSAGPRGILGGAAGARGNLGTVSGQLRSGIGPMAGGALGGAAWGAHAGLASGLLAGAQQGPTPRVATLEPPVRELEV
jgi:hypothetical protein